MPRDQRWSLEDIPLSPIYGLLETTSNLPFVDQTGLGKWLRTDPGWRGVRNFQRQEPGAALLAEMASYAIPFGGWGAATAKAGTGLLGASTRAATRAASLVKNPQAAFALGETVRFAPPSAAITAFDYLGDQYDSPLDAAASFGLGTLGGAGVQALGHSLTPFVRNVPMIGASFKAVFDPGPQLSALYGFSNNAKAAASRAAGVQAVQEATSPLLEPQLRAGAIWDLVQEAQAGLPAWAQSSGMAPEEVPQVLDLLRNHYEVEANNILRYQFDPADERFRFPADIPKEQRQAIHGMLGVGPNSTGNRVSAVLDGNPGSPNNASELANRLGLPPEWRHLVVAPRITQATVESGNALRREIGLEAHNLGKGFRRLERTLPDGSTQLWSIQQEPDGGWFLATELPGEHRMTFRARHNAGDANELGRAFFSFKTHDPGRFFENDGWRLDIDNPGFKAAETLGPAVWDVHDRIPRGASDFLDKAMDFRKLYLNKETVRSVYNAMLAGKSAKQGFVKELLSGPDHGKEIANFIETYAAPTDHQLKNSPEAGAILGMYRALFDAAEGRKSRIMHGTAAIPKGKSPLGAITDLFAPPNMDDAQALASQLRKTLQADPKALELIRKFDKGQDIPLKSIAGTPAGKWLTLALQVNDQEVAAINKAIEALQKVGATDARLIPARKKHFGVSRRWDGSNFFPIYREGQTEPVAVVAGGSRAHAEQKAKAWIEAERAALAAQGKPAQRHRLGQHYVAGEGEDIPPYIRQSVMQPGLLEPRAGMRGFENEFEPYKHVDDFIAELEENYARRWRYAASTIADALTTGKLNQLRNSDPHAFQILNTRIMQLKGQQGPLDKRLNQIVDKVAAPYLGTNSLSKAADAVNEFNFHMLHGVGNIATPMLNLTSVLQTQLPEAVNFLTSNPELLKGMSYQFPVFGADGLPRPGFNVATDPIGLLWGAFKRATNPDPETREVYQRIFNSKEMGVGLANEYTGQDRTIAARVSEGIRGPEDVAHWLKRGSSLLMSKTEQISRTIAAGMAMEAMGRFEALNGVKFNMDQKVNNALRFVRMTNYGYFSADRPMMYTTPLGAIFGNQKTWMTNYLFMMAHYLGLAQKGNVAPLLFTLGTTAALGGAFAVPMVGMGIDALTETFAGQDAREFMFDKFGEGGNAISFGLPAMFGVSLQGNVAAPGSNLAHDTEFFFTLVALERAKLMGRAFGRAWDDQMILGLNPLKDELWRKQAAQAFAPRAVYRTFESIMDEQLRSAATGYPLVKEFGLGARILHSLGFRDTDIAVQYAAYDSLMKDRDAMRHKIGVLGDAYAQASLANDRQEMMRVLQVSAVQGVDVNSVMRSAQVRMRNAGYDMFGRNFTSQQLERYHEQLEAGGR